MSISCVYHDHHFKFSLPHQRIQAFADLRVYQNKGNNIAVVTDPRAKDMSPLSEGVSPTNAAEYIWQATSKLPFVIHKLIEHYPQRGPDNDPIFAETFSEVVAFSWVNGIPKHIHFRYLERNKLQQILGRDFPNWYDAKLYLAYRQSGRLQLSKTPMRFDLLWVDPQSKSPVLGLKNGAFTQLQNNTFDKEIGLLVD